MWRISSGVGNEKQKAFEMWAIVGYLFLDFGLYFLFLKADPLVSIFPIKASDNRNPRPITVPS